MNCDIRLIQYFFDELSKNKIKYCILRNADEVECGDAHDIDMAVDNGCLKKTENVLMSVAKEQGWKLHVKTGSAKDRFNIKCYHFFTVTDVQERKDIHIVHFDIFPTFTWNGYILLDNETLTQGIDESTVYHRADPVIEAVTKLFIRLLYNGYIKEKYKPYIKNIFANNETSTVDILNRFLSSTSTEYIIKSVIKENWKDIEDNRERFVTDIKKISIHNHIGHKMYLIRKVMNKAGIMVAFEGTDGSGKSTIINALPRVLGNSFPEDMQDYYHWRPGFIKKEKKVADGQPIVVTAPHAQKPYGRIKSFAKYMFFNMDYILGYWCKVRWQIAKGHLVVFDRYYYDYYLDKLRYRLTISDFTLDFFKCLIPKPDLTLLLVGDAEVLYERKKEIPVEEIQKQIDRMMEKKKCFNNPVLIDVNQPIERVVNQAACAILNAASSKVKDKRFT